MGGSQFERDSAFCLYAVLAVSRLLALSLAHPTSTLPSSSPPYPKVGTVVDLLNDNEYNCFPVVDHDGGLHGTMIRNHLTSLVVHKAFSPHVCSEPQSQHTQIQKSSETQTLSQPRNGQEPNSLSLNC